MRINLNYNKISIKSNRINRFNIISNLNVNDLQVIRKVETKCYLPDEAKQKDLTENEAGIFKSWLFRCKKSKIMNYFYGLDKLLIDFV